MIPTFTPEQDFHSISMQREKRRRFFINIIGWAGSLLVVLAYFLLTSEHVSKEHLFYKVCNLVGALFLAYRVYCDRNWSNLFLEAIFISIAIKELLC